MTGQSANNNFVQRLTEIVEQNMDNEQFGVSQLAREMGMSRSNLHRKVKAETNKSVSRFIGDIRLKEAAKLLSENLGNVSEIAYKVGFGSVTYFSKCFHDLYGFAPGELLNGNHKVAIEEYGNTKDVNNHSVKKQILISVFSALTLAVIIFLLFQASNKPTLTTNSIIIMSPESEQTNSEISWIFEGIYYELRNKLLNIDNIHVCSETTAGYYAGSDNVIESSSRGGIDYILEFESAITNNTDYIYVTLTDTHNDKLLLSRPYAITDFNDNFVAVTEEIANILNNKIKGATSEKDKIAIDNKITQSTEASILYYKAMDYLERWDRREGHKYLHMAKTNLKKAIEIDSTFSEAYVNLGQIYTDKIFPFTTKWPKRAHELLDSGLLMANLALKYDEKLGTAWALKYRYYEKNGMTDHPEAKKCLRMKYKYRDSESGYYIGELARADGNFDYFGVIDYFNKYRETKPDEELISPWMLRTVTQNLMSMNFPDVAKKYAYQLFLLENDTAMYHELLDRINIWTWDFSTLENKWLKEYEKNSESLEKIGSLIFLYFNMQEYDKAYKYVLEMEKLEKKLNKEPGIGMFRAQLYMMNGRTEEGKEQFQKMIQKNKEIYNAEFSNAPKNKITFSIFAAAYSGMGQKEKALQNLQKLTERKVYSILLLNQKSLSLYDNIRDEPEYKKILNQLWNDYYEERNRIKKILIKKGEIKS